MSFLAPLFLVGAAAIALPIVFHLIRRTSREKIPFSSLMFLLPTPPRLTRKSRLEHILLLILRCAALILLAFAFARPFWHQPAAAQAAASKRTVILVDTSASMRREQLFSDARAGAAAITADAGAGGQVAIVAFDRATRSVLTFEEWARTEETRRREFALERLKAVEPGWSGTHLGHAILAATELLAHHAPTEGDKSATADRGEIVVISDFQEGAHLDGLQGYLWPRNITVRAVAIKARKVTNAGIQLLADSSSAGSSKDMVKVRVTNSRQSTSEQFDVRWAGSPSNTAAAYVAPGQSRVVELPRPVRADRIVLTGDEADFDNSAWFVIPRREEVEVAYLGDNSSTDPHQPSFYIRRALSDTANETVRVMPFSDAVASNRLDASKLLIIAQPAADGQLDVISNRLHHGATVLWAINSTADVPALSRVTGIPVSAREASLGSGKYAMLGEIDFKHPLFAPFAEARFSDFTKIHFWKYRQLEIETAKNVAVLARFETGEPALIQVGVGTGTVFVLASGWQPAESQLALSSKFVPLLYSILELSGAIKDRTLAYHTGDEVDLSRVAPGARILVRTPAGRQVEVTPPATSFQDTAEPGIYTAAPAATPGQSSFEFAVNLPPEESRTAPIALEELEKLGVPMKAVASGESARVARHAAQARIGEIEARQRLWRWIIAGTFIALIGETWMAARLSRAATPGT